MSKIYYVADFGYGQPMLAKITVNRETEKTIWIDERENLLGWQYLSKRPRKDSLNLFDSPQVAWDWLIEEAESYVEKQRQKLMDAEAVLVELKRALVEE